MDLPNGIKMWGEEQKENLLNHKIFVSTILQQMFILLMESSFCHTRLHLGFSAKLRIWQVPACKMEPRSGTIITDWASQPASQPASPPPTYFDTSAILTFCPHLLCLSPPIMSVPTYYVCPHLLCLSPPIISVPTHHFFYDKHFLNLEYLRNVRVCLECFWRVFGRGLEGSMVSLSLRRGHLQKMFWNPIF